MWWNRNKQKIEIEIERDELKNRLASLEKAYEILWNLRAPLVKSNIATWTFLYRAGLHIEAQAIDTFDTIFGAVEKLEKVSTK